MSHDDQSREEMERDTLTEIQTFINNYGADDLYQVAQFIRRLGVENPADVVKYPRGLCLGLLAFAKCELGMTVAAYNSVNYIVQQIIAHWEHRSPSLVYPVPASLDDKSFTMANSAFNRFEGRNRNLINNYYELNLNDFTITDPDEYYEQLEHHKKYYWTGEYGELRRNLCRYISGRLIDAMLNLEIELTVRYSPLTATITKQSH